MVEGPRFERGQTPEPQEEPKICPATQTVKRVVRYCTYHVTGECLKGELLKSRGQLPTSVSAQGSIFRGPCLKEQAAGVSENEATDNPVI